MTHQSSSKSTSVRLQILELAKQHKITTANVSLEKLTAAIARSTDDNLHTDDVQLLLVRLRQQDMISKDEFAGMLRDYLKELK